MPLIETKGAASAQGFGLTIGGAQPVYIEDVFSTYLYTGNGSTQTITNGIDLSGKGGLVITKSRSSTTAPWWISTNSVSTALRSDSQAASQNTSSFFTGVTANGYTLDGTNDAAYGPYGFDINNVSYVSWTFRKQPKFFDVVTYTGTGSAQSISHNLGSTPGCIIVKRTDTTSEWPVYHRSLGPVWPRPSAEVALQLNNAVPIFAATTYWNSTAPTSTGFTVGNNSNTNASGGTYVAYLFAHDAGGFGLSGSDNVISCGSFTTNGSGNATVNLGYEPQFLLMKSAQTGAYDNDWYLVDSMRGSQQAPDSSNTYGYQFRLRANSAGIEQAAGSGWFTSTGFYYTNQSFVNTYIYIAIRRGPMKVPTSGTSVFSPQTYTATGARQTITTSFTPDSWLGAWRSGPIGQSTHPWSSRLTGINYIPSAATGIEVPDYSYQWYDGQYVVSASGFGITQYSGAVLVNYIFARAPSFFDVVCYTGNGTARTINHNLGVAPELAIVRKRDGAGGDWYVAATSLSAIWSRGPALNNSASQFYWSGPIFNSTAPTSSVFSLGSGLTLNESGANYIAYLFATCPGVSKVGSYTGTGALQTVNCGFTGGARFILIKRTDSTGDWYVYDSARGISSGSDPYILTNSNAAEVTGTNYVDTTSVGFQVTAAAPAGLNANGGTFIFLAIA